MKRFPKTKSELKKCINAFIMTGMGTSLDSFLSEYSDPVRKAKKECKDGNHSFRFLTRDELRKAGIKPNGTAKWGCEKCSKVVESM